MSISAVIVTSKGIVAAAAGAATAAGAGTGTGFGFTAKTFFLGAAAFFTGLASVGFAGATLTFTGLTCGAAGFVDLMLFLVMACICWRFPWDCSLVGPDFAYQQQIQHQKPAIRGFSHS
ncbi:MAG: hypothetical protein JNN01_14605 [Opitutaceae bacterium]|nr:hypothetical protein [Opitutaceae bacterium]